MITVTWKKLRYHEKQSKLWRTKARFVGVAAGRGSCKTELARRRVIRFLPVKKPWADPKYFYALPTYKQARRVVWRNIQLLIPPEWIKKVNESEMRIDTHFGSSLYVVGLDRPQRIEGDQWDGGVVDESCDQRPGAYEKSILPAMTHRYGWCWRIGVPKRVGIGAAEFKHWCFNTADEMYTWSSEDILTPEQIIEIRSQMDEKDYNEQFNASWEDLTGVVFHSFSDVFNVKQVEYDKELPLLIGSDFNVDPMAWVVCQRPSDRELVVLDELWIRNTNTRATLDELWSRYGQYHKAGFEFYGDATGRSRNTRASESDYLQIKNDKRFNPALVFYPKKNPIRANRFAACNAMFCNADKHRACIIHPRCRRLIADLASRTYVQGTKETNDIGDIGHITDALGYIIHRLWPIKQVIEVIPKVWLSDD